MCGIEIIIYRGFRIFIMFGVCQCLFMVVCLIGCTVYYRVSQENHTDLVRSRVENQGLKGQGYVITNFCRNDAFAVYLIGHITVIFN